MSEESKLDQFISDLIADGLAERTARLYASDAEAFLDSVEAAADALTKTVITEWLETLAEQFAASTITRRLTSLRRYCRWLMARGVLTDDPTEGLRVPASASSPVSVAYDDIRPVLVAPDPYTAIGVRDRAIMMLLSCTGMELGELCALDYHDCQADAARIIVGGGRRLRDIALTGASQPLLRYLYCVRDLQQGDALFLSNRGERISERAVQHRVRHYAERQDVAVTVKDLIEYGRVACSRGDPEYVARKLGFSRSDAVQRRYRQPPRRKTTPDCGDYKHPSLRPLRGMDPRGMPAGRPTPRPPTRAEVWERLEQHMVSQSARPRPAEREWLEATGLTERPPEERIRALTGPMRALGGDGALPGRVRELLDDEVARAAYATDTGLLLLHSRLMDFSPDLRAYTRLSAAVPLFRERMKQTIGDAPDDMGWMDGHFVMDVFGSPERVLSWADTVLSTHEGQTVLWTLVGAQWEHLSWLRECASKYYAIPERRSARRELDAALIVACVAGLVLCSPQALERVRVSEAVAEPATMYFMDTVMYILHQLLRLLGLAEDGAVLAGIRSDVDFAEAFEREWDALLPFTNRFFGFGVVPRISYEDMVRYHSLRYVPGGDLARPPYEVGDFLIHQAKSSGHFLRPFAPKRLQGVFLECVRPLYDRLVERYIGRARKALTSRYRDQDVDEIFERAGREIEAAFREAYERYDFYQHPPGGPQTEISSGLLGWRRREDIRQLADRLGIDCELARTPFAAYARGYLDRRIKHLGWESLGRSEGQRIQDPDGRYYYTISRMARRFKRSASFLRELDDLLEPVRVSDVFDGPHSNRKRLPDSARLYPADGDALKKYEDWLGSQYPRLEAEDLRTEAQVARWLGVSVWWLRKRRERGELAAGRKGRFVVYNADQRSAARQLRDAQ